MKANNIFKPLKTKQLHKKANVLRLENFRIFMRKQPFFRTDTVNTFEQLIGRQITKILRLDTGEDFPPLSFPLAVYIMLDNNSGLFIGFGFHSETIELNYMTLADLEDYYGTEYGETCLNTLDNDDPLNKLVGQKIKSLKVGQLQDDKTQGDTFVIKSGQYAGVILAVDNNKVTIYSTKIGGQISFDTEEVFPNKQSWVLT